MSVLTRPAGVIDIDSHFLEPLDWLQQVDPGLADELPKVSLEHLAAQAIAGDAMVATTADDPSSFDVWTMYPVALREAREALAAAKDPTEASAVLKASGAYPSGSHDPVERLAFLDEQGIDVQFILPTIGHAPATAALGLGRLDLFHRGLEAYNSWATATVAGFTDRLIPASLIDLTDAEWAMGELVRTRARGSAMAWIRAEPPGCALSHPRLDDVWATFAELGTAVLLHLNGGRPPILAAWMDNGGRPFDYVFLNHLAGRLLPQVALADLVLGGVFARHPALTCFVAEFGAEWVGRLGMALDSHAGRSTWTHELRPSEYLRRQVRVSPLLHRPEPFALDDQPEGMLAFSSDYPHPEGAANPVGVAATSVSASSAGARADFFGGSVRRTPMWSGRQLVHP